MATSWKSSPAIPTVPHPTPTAAARYPRVSLRKPIHNPYDKFSAREFDDWIGGITSTLRRALGYEPDGEPEVKTNIYDALARARIDVCEDAPARDIGQDEENSDEQDACEDSFAYVKSRRAKGKARDPRDGPGFGNESQPIELLSDSEEEVQENEIIDEVSEEGEEDEEDEGEYEEDSEEDGEEDRNAPSSSGIHAVTMDYVSSGEEDDVQRQERDANDDYEQQYVHGAAPTRPVYVQSFDEDEIIDSADSSDDSNDGEEGNDEHLAAHSTEGINASASTAPYIPFGLPVIASYTSLDEDEQLEYTEGDVSLCDGADASVDAGPDDGSPEIPDPWDGPRNYAEDFYSGGDRFEGSTPNHLTPRLRSVSPGLHEPEFINMDSDLNKEQGTYSSFRFHTSRCPEFVSPAGGRTADGGAVWDWNSPSEFSRRTATVSGHFLSKDDAAKPDHEYACPADKLARPSDNILRAGDSFALQDQKLVYPYSANELAYSPSDHAPAPAYIPIDPVLLGESASAPQYAAPEVIDVDAVDEDPLATLLAENDEEGIRRADEELVKWGFVDGDGGPGKAVQGDEAREENGGELANETDVKINEEGEGVQAEAGTDIEVGDVTGTEDAAVVGPAQLVATDMEPVQDKDLPSSQENPAEDATTETTPAPTAFIAPSSLITDPAIPPALEYPSPPPSPRMSGHVESVVSTEADVTAHEPTSDAAVEEVHPEVHAMLRRPSRQPEVTRSVETSRLAEDGRHFMGEASEEYEDEATTDDVLKVQYGREQHADTEPPTDGIVDDATTEEDPILRFQSEDQQTDTRAGGTHEPKPPLTAADVADETDLAPTLTPTHPERHVTFVKEPQVTTIDVDAARPLEETQDPEYLVEEIDDDAESEFGQARSVEQPQLLLVTDEEPVGERKKDLIDAGHGESMAVKNDAHSDIAAASAVVTGDTDDCKGDGMLGSPTIPAPVSADPNVPDPAKRTPSPTPSSDSDSDSPIVPSSTRSYKLSAVPPSLWKELEREYPTTFHRSLSGLFTPAGESVGNTPVASDNTSDAESVEGNSGNGRGRLVPVKLTNVPLAEDAHDLSTDGIVTDGSPVPAKDSPQVVRDENESAEALEDSDLDADGEDDPDYLPTPTPAEAQAEAMETVLEKVEVVPPDTQDDATAGRSRPSDVQDDNVPPDGSIVIQSSLEDPFALMGDKSTVAPGAIQVAESSGETMSASKLKDTADGTASVVECEASGNPISSDFADIPAPETSHIEELTVNSQGVADTIATGQTDAETKAPAEEHIAQQETAASTSTLLQETESVAESAVEVEDVVANFSTPQVDGSERAPILKRKRLTAADLTATRRITRSRSDLRDNGSSSSAPKRGTKGAGKPLARSKIKATVRRDRAPSESGSVASTASVNRLLAPVSRAASVTSSSADSYDVSTPTVTKPTADVRPPLIHSHTQVFIHHHHGRAPPPPPVGVVPAIAAPRAKTNTPESSRAASPAPQTPSTSVQKPGPIRRLPSLNSPVTRSNCRFHKISLPREENGPRMSFVVPGCSLGDGELMEDEEIEDHGFATTDDHARMVPDIEALDFNPYMVGVLRQLVGVDLLREQEVFYLPNPGEPLPKKKRRKARTSLVDKARMAQAQAHESSSRSSTPSVASHSRRDDDETASVIGTSSHSRGTGSTASSTGELTDPDDNDDNEEPPAKRHKLSPSENGAQSATTPVKSSIRVDNNDAEGGGSQPSRLRRSKRRALNTDAAAYQPRNEEESDEDPVLEKSGKSRKGGAKRSRTQDDVSETAPKSKRSRLRKSTSALNSTRPG
ncbi:hypothetical protein K488DRAFT_68976 [Vararia minispora EC-137]|uniref:Uncharacterized protein n=1 Tax=Vararia minispora EC-137 TaxID=1314806 RepID=A0ACB8QTK4_9AGAM|nr:hypothetical protein K488DRAFT_68976 [Vararia minispora EC-137]